MNGRRIAVWLMRNACRRNKRTLICVLGFLCLLFLNQGTDYGVDLEQYNLFVWNSTTTRPLDIQTTEKVRAPIVTTTIKPDGFSLARSVLTYCPSQNRTLVSDARRSPLDKSDQIMVRKSRSKSAMLCPVYKVGSTFWRRIYMMESNDAYKKSNPYELPFDKDLKGSVYKLHTRHDQNFTFMFTRDPYSRLFSTYVDKLLAPNPYYWKVLGEKIKKLNHNVRSFRRGLCAHDVTFPEFIKYVIFSLESNKDVDPHFVQMEKNCRPCDVKYDFIGKMESFATDSAVCLKKLKLDGVADILKQNGSELASLDAMLDTVTQPFSFRKSYLRCISFSDALQRAWKKLQLRGLTGEDALDLSSYGHTFDGMNVKWLMARAQESRRNATSDTRKKLKQTFYQDYWKQINVTDLYKIKSLYSVDFNMFNYDSEPFAVFQGRTL